MLVVYVFVVIGIITSRQVISVISYEDQAGDNLFKIPCDIQLYPIDPVFDNRIGHHHRSTDIFQLLKRIEDERCRYSRRTMLIEYDIFNQNTSEILLKSFIFPNPPLSNTNVDVNNYLVDGEGLGAKFSANDGKILLGHLLMPSDREQSYPTIIEDVTCLVGIACSFYIQTRDTNDSPVDHNEANFRARLFGDSIIHVNVVSIGQGKYQASYTAYDEGLYILEVFLDSVEPKTHGEMPYNVGQVIYRSQHPLTIAANPEMPFVQPDVRCNTADAGPGRWVYMEDGECRPRFCSGVNLREAQISEMVGLNMDYVWVPYTCHYHIYSSGDLATCARNKSLTTWRFNGDSLSAELCHSMKMILTHHTPPHGNTMGYEDLPSVITSEGLEYVIMHFGALRTDMPHKFSVDVRQFGDAHILMDHDLTDTVKADYLNNVRNHMSNIPDRSTRRVYIYINPNVVREQHIPLHIRMKYYARHRGRQQHRAVTSVGENELQRLSLEAVAGLDHIRILNGKTPTEDHWFAAWDGMHYLSNHYNFHLYDRRWFGGVAMMMTQILINDACADDW